MLALLGVGIAAPAGADTLDDLREKTRAAQERKAAAEQNIEQLSADLEDTDAELGAAYLRLQEVEAQLPVAQAQLEQAEAELAEAQRAADALAQRLVDAQSEESSLVARIAADDQAAQDTRETIAELARRAYRGEGTPDRMSLVMGAASAQDFVQQLSLSQTAMRTQTNSLDDLQQSEATSRNSQARLEAVRETIAGLKAEADQAVIDANAARDAADARRQEVESLIVEQRTTAQVIEQRKAEQQAARDQAASDRAALDSEIQDLFGLTEAEKQRLREKQAEAQRQAEAAAQANASSGGSSSAPAPAPVQPAPAPGGGSSSSTYGLPTALGYITSSYGWRMHPILGYARLHAGTDFRAYCGTPILAVHSGTVQWAKSVAGLGNQVLIDHGQVNGERVMTSSNHLSSFAVRAGQTVAKGDVIGYSGSTGTSTACHLHFEMYVNGANTNASTVDPMTRL